MQQGEMLVVLNVHPSVMYRIAWRLTVDLYYRLEPFFGKNWVVFSAYEREDGYWSAKLEVAGHAPSFELLDEYILSRTDAETLFPYLDLRTYNEFHHTARK